MHDRSLDMATSRGIFRHEPLFRRVLLAAMVVMSLAGQAFAMGGGSEGGAGGSGGGHGGGHGGDGAGSHDGGMGSMDDSANGTGSMGGMGGSGGMHDHEMALQQHRRGMAPSLKALMRQVRSRHPGKVLDVRMVRDRKGSAYIFTILQGDRIRQVRVPLAGGNRVQGRRMFNFNSSGARR